MATTPEGRDQFLEDIFPAEMAALRSRRAAVAAATGVPMPPVEPAAHDGKPDVDRGLRGLAFSGGGIRSAAFNLGVTQAMAEHDALGQMDYLSTVSGGGYIGSTVSMLLRHPDRVPDASGLPIHYDSQRPRTAELGEKAYSEPPALRHLRDEARYLDTRGLFDKALMGVLLVRNALINAAGMVVLLTIAAAAGVILKHLAIAVKLREAESSSTLLFGESTWIPASVVLLWMLVFVGLRIDTRGFSAAWGRRRRERFRGTMTWATILTIAAVAAWAAPWLVRKTIDLSTHLTGSSTLTLGGLAAAAAAVGEFAKILARANSTLAKMAAMVALAAIGPLVAWLLFTVFAGWAWFGVGLGAANFEESTRAFILLGLGVGVVGLFWIDSGPNRTSMHQFYRDRLSKLFLFDVDSTGCVRQDACLTKDTSAAAPIAGPHTPPPGAGGVGAGRYRETDTATTPDRLKLSALFADGQVGPYHLINAAVNLQKSTDNRLRGRGADFFLFSPRWCGSRSTGYCPTARLESADPAMTVGTAIAISGAAASTYMGAQTNRLAVMTIALVNVRLGYWLPNPGKVLAGDAPSFVRSLTSGPEMLLAELCGELSADQPYVNVSDGGHAENLAVYELLRRRCALIIASDAEADPNFEFPSLSKIIRLARTDLGIDITLDVSQIRKGNTKDGVHFAIGTIRYPGDPEDAPSGTLVYVKASLAGEDEAVYVRQQPLWDKDFPHTTTADQFFDEGQFEAYRALGRHAAGRMLAGLEKSGKAPWVVAI